MRTVSPGRSPRSLFLLLGLVACQGSVPGLAPSIAPSSDTALALDTGAPSATLRAELGTASVSLWIEDIGVRTDAALRTFQVGNAGFAARHEKLDYDIQVDEAGFRVQHLDDDIGVSFTSWGRGDDLRGVNPAQPTLDLCSHDGAVLPEGDCMREISFAHGDGVVQWLENSSGGPEQGWTLSERPAGSGPVVVQVRVDGADVSIDDDAVIFSGASGAQYRYHRLAATDAAGRSLPAEFRVDGDTVSILVDDTGATWPIEIDPAMDNVADVTAAGTASSGFLGISVASAGDVNNDGFDDVIVGSSGENGRFGAARIYFGGSSMDATADVTVSATVSGDFGRCVASAGDLNADGFDDVLVGAPNESGSLGAVRVYYGGSSMDTTADVTFTGTDTAGSFGRSSAAAGDVNADGYDDLIIGAFGEGSGLGAARIYFGSASMDGTADITITGGAVAGYLGRSVAYAGDVNGDSIDDVLVGSYLESSGLGAARVYYGGTSMDNSADVIISGTAVGGRLGYSVARAGDVNNDGHSDIIVGSYQENSSAGAARIYFGSATLMNSDPDVIIQGTDASGQMGESVAYGGDVNGDGIDDVIVGSFNESSGMGAARVYVGGSTLDDVADVEMLGTDASPGYFGYSVASAGDVNADGLADVIVGAYNESAGLGNARIYLGSDDDVDNDLVLGASDCDDNDASVGEAITRYTDSDGDGYGTSISALACPADPAYADNSDDCNDSDAAVNPAATEVCDALLTDEDCNGFADDDDPNVTGTDTYYGDADGDSYGGVLQQDFCIPPSDYVTNTEDCDDTDATIHPGMTELCDDENDDEDCNGVADNDDPAATGLSTFYIDADSDNYGGTTSTDACDQPTGYVADNTDCDDSNAAANPGQVEICDDADVDEDCNGVADNGDINASGTSVYYVDSDGDTYGSTSAAAFCDQASGYAVNNTDCDDSSATVHPGATEIVGDEIDEDCDADEVCYADDDSDGYRPDETSTMDSADSDCQDVGEASASALTGDCDDTSAAYNPAAVEDDCTDPNDYNCDGSTGFADADADGYAACEDCDDANADVHPGATDVPGDGVDSDCDGGETCYVDADDDGYRADDTTMTGSGVACDQPGEAVASDPSGDCDDADAARNPGEPEIVGDGIDQDCDGDEVCYVDADGDTYRPDETSTVASADPDCDDAGEAHSSALTGDCDDADAAYNPAALEEDCADPNDYNCDGSTGYADADADSFAACEDCNDADATVNPDGTELPGDGLDSNCDGLETCYVDADDDGYRPDDSTVDGVGLACDQAGEAVSTDPDGDCNDADATVNPGATELAGDEVDQDCNGTEVCYVDGDGDGYRPDETSTVDSTDLDCNDSGEVPDEALVGDCDDADPAYHMGADESDCEDPNDYNCDGSVGYDDLDQDGFAACQECDDGAADVNPDAVEVCNGIDDNCDNVVDDDAVDQTTWYADADGDGYTDPDVETDACEPPDFYAAASAEDDCDDSNATIHPGAEEIADDGIDQDCAEDTGSTGDDTGGSIQGGGGAGCATVDGRAAGWALGLVGLMALRRRRSA